MARHQVRELTEKQKAIFCFLASFTAENGFPPTLREVGINFKIAPTSALEHLRALEKKGFIKRLKFKSRCLELLKKSNEI